MTGVIVPLPASLEPGGPPWRYDPSVRIRPAVPDAEPVARTLADVSGLVVDVTPGPGITLRLDGESDLGDEGYELTVAADGPSVTAYRPAGLFWGTQTLRQLMAPSTDIPGMRIRDVPRFAWRGLMLDVARHFFGPADVMRVIDIAAAYKLNVLHLHLTDDQGWRIAIDAWPELTRVSGKSAVGGVRGGYFTKDDYRKIVAYAAERFVTVVPEIDVPGHTHAALVAYPALTRDGERLAPSTGIEVGFSALTLDKPLTYQFLEEVFGELAELTPGPYMHLGGDEALTLTAEQYVPFVERAQKIVTATGKLPVGWQEIAAAELVPGAVVQYWNTGHGPDRAVEAVAKGAKLILSPADRVYLDMKYDAGTALGLDWAGTVAVRDAYGWDPATLADGIVESDLLGVEAALWTETITTREELEFMLLPRLAAVAEVAWTPAHRREWQGFSKRLAAQARGWASAGVNFHRSAEVDWPELR